MAPLFLALSKGHAECASSRLLDARAAADVVEPLRAQTAQHAAAAAEPAVAPALLERLLVDRGALHADREGFTALHVAAGRGCVARRCSCSLSARPMPSSVGSRRRT